MNSRWPSSGWLLFAAALALRAAWVLYHWTTRGPQLDYPDEELHWQLATNLLHEGSLISDDGRLAARMPLYPLFLSLFAWLGDGGVLAARLAQALLGAATAAIACRLARAAYDPRAALVASVLVCCDPFAIFFANLLLTEVLFTLIAVGLVAGARRLSAGRAGSAGALVLVGLLGVAAILTRPSAAGWIPLLWLLIAWLASDRRRMCVRLLACPMILVVLLLPWGLRNRAALGSCAWLSTNGGVTLYDAQGPRADGSSNQSFLRTMPELEGLGEVELDRVLRRRALAQMREDPARVLRLAVVKLLRTWSPLPNVEEYRSGPAALVGAAFTILVLIGGLVGMARTVRSQSARPGRLHALLWLPVVYFTLVHCVYIGSVRYRVPLMPLLSLAAAGAVARPIIRVEKRAEGPRSA